MINWDDLQKIDFPWKKRKGFFPVNTLNGKNNFMPLITTRTDLTAVLGIYLDVPDDKLREQIIFTHYLAQYTKAVSKEPLAVWIHGRDGQKITGSHLGSIDPWDFVIETNEGRLFNVEIVSIAESTRKYSYLNDMKRFRLQLDKPKIPLSMLKKLDISFPDQKVAEQIQNYERQNIGRNDLVANPFFEQDSSLFATHQPKPKSSLGDLVADAIANKSSKKHANKNSTVLILDNRTSYFDIDDLRQVIGQFGNPKYANQFSEVWFYTGYYSDHDGNNAEYSLAPMQLPLDVWKKLHETIVSSGRSISVDGLFFI